MGATDKAKNAAEDMAGKAKEAVGDATGNEQLQAEGQADQAEAKVKKTGERVKDTVKDIAE